MAEPLLPTHGVPLKSHTSSFCRRPIWFAFLQLLNRQVKLQLSVVPSDLLARHCNILNNWDTFLKYPLGFVNRPASILKYGSPRIEKRYADRFTHASPADRVRGRPILLFRENLELKSGLRVLEPASANKARDKQCGSDCKADEDTFHTCRRTLPD